MSIAKSSFLFAGGTFFSRILGLVRDQIILGIYGATIFQDAFIIAFRIPNLMREMFAEGALGSSFTKVYSSLHEQNPKEAQTLLLQSLYLTFLFSIALCGAGIILAPYLVHGMTFLKETDQSKTILIEQTTTLTRLLFPYLGFTIVGSVVMGALHQKGRFFLSAFAPTLFNLGNIIGALWISKLLDRHCPTWFLSLIAEPKISGLAFGVLLGGALHFGFQLWGIWGDSIKGGKINLWKFPWSKDIKQVTVIMIPAALAASTGPINIMINTNFASSLAPGVVTWLNTAFRLLQLPIGIFAVAVGVTALPRLARSITKSHKVITREVSLELQTACELMLWLLVPCMIFLLINKLPITKLLFEHGHFGPADALGTSNAIFAYSYGMLGYGLIKVLTSFYYAVERTSYAMVVAIFSVFVNFTGNALLVKQFGHMGLAYTSSITLSMNALLLIVGLYKHHLSLDYQSLGKTVALLALASIVCMITQSMLGDFLENLCMVRSLHLKLTSGIIVVANSIVTVACFGCFSLLHLGKPVVLRLATFLKRG